MVRTLRRRTSALGSWGLLLGALAAPVGAPSLAHAQPPANPRAPAGALTVHRDPAADAISLGRTRMAKGDCVGALEAFDAALRTSFDVTVRRDRGLCHEQLGHPFPAIDDLRAYLTALPDAPDAEDIRTRLNQMEVANGLGGTGTGGTATANHEDPFAVEAKPAAAAPAQPGQRPHGVDYDDEQALNARWDEAEASPLRRGSGLSFGVYGRGFGGSANGVYGYGVGATVRGALGGVSTIYGEIGYVTYRAGSDDATGEREGGLSLGLGYEVRIRLDELTSNAIIIAAIVNYERVTDMNSRAVFNYLNPRAKLGYRHVFGPGFGVEIGGELAQPLDLSALTAPITYFGGTLALLVGF